MSSFAEDYRDSAHRTVYRCIAAGIIGALASIGCLAQDVAQPIVGISVLGDFDGVVEQGEPLRLVVELRADDAAGAGDQVVLAPSGRAWTDSVAVRLVTMNGQDTGVTAAVVGVPEESVATLARSRIAGGLWRLAPGATALLAPGAYSIRATVEIVTAARGSGGWTGRADSPDVRVRIVAASTDPYRHGQHQVAIAQDLVIDGRLEDAARVIDALLEQQPEHVTAWTVRAVISESAGNIPAALYGIGRAREIYYGTGGGEFTEPNPDLETIQQRLTATLIAADPTTASGASAPEWSWPADVLLAAPLPAPSVAPGAPAGEQPTSPSAGSTISGNLTRTSGGIEILAVPAADEHGFLSDPTGQWAVSATASSEYAPDRYNAMRATGAPDVEDYSDNPNAWCHSSTSNPEDWLELAYERPVFATELRVRQNYTPGTIAKVEAFAADGRALLLWEGTDPNVYPDREISWFVLRTEPTPFPVTRIRLTLNIAAIGGWKQIDAVQLVGSAPGAER